MGPQTSGCTLGSRNCVEDFTWLFAGCIIVFLAISEKLLNIIFNTENPALCRLEFSTGYHSDG